MEAKSVSVVTLSFPLPSAKVRDTRWQERYETLEICADLFVLSCGDAFKSRHVQDFGLSGFLVVQTQSSHQA